MNIKELPLSIIEPLESEYKKLNSSIYSYLRMSLEVFNQLRPITVVQAGVDTYECVEGRKILRVLREMGRKTCYVNCLTNVDKEKTYRIGLLLNEISFSTDYISLAKIVQGMSKISNKQQLYSTLPFDKDTIDDFIALESFNWDLYKENETVTQSSLFEEALESVKENVKQEIDTQGNSLDKVIIIEDLEENKSKEEVLDQNQIQILDNIDLQKVEEVSREENIETRSGQEKIVNSQEGISLATQEEIKSQLNLFS